MRDERGRESRSASCPPCIIYTPPSGHTAARATRGRKSDGPAAVQPASQGELSWDERRAPLRGFAMTAPLHIRTIVSMPFEENTYVVWQEGRTDTVVFDPGLEPDLILDFLR